VSDESCDCLRYLQDLAFQHNLSLSFSLFLFPKRLYCETRQLILKNRQIPIKLSSSHVSSPFLLPGTRTLHVYIGHISPLSSVQLARLWLVLRRVNDVTPVPPVPFSRGRTVIFDIVEYVVMEWTMPNESRICRICRRVLILKRRSRVLLASLPQSSIGQKRIAGLKN
jgi:hypothetical protein